MQSNGSTFIQTFAKTENLLLLIHRLIYKAERTTEKNHHDVDHSSSEMD